MVYDYKSKKGNRFRNIILFENKIPKIVGRLIMGKDKGFIRLNSKFIKTKGLMYLTITNNNTFQ